MLILIHLLLLVDAELTRAHVDEQQKATHNREDLEEIVLRKVLVRVVGVKLRVIVLAHALLL